MKIMFKAKLKAGIKKDEDTKVYVTYAPALRLYSQGATAIEAKSALEDAIQSFLFVAYKHGVLEKCLKSTGFDVDVNPLCSQCESEEFIHIKEETILQDGAFEDIFEIPAFLPLAIATA